MCACSQLAPNTSLKRDAYVVAALPHVRPLALHSAAHLLSNPPQAQTQRNPTMVNLRSAVIPLFSAAILYTPAFGQGRPDPAKLIAAQQAALAKLAFMDGIWRGTAWTLLPSGEKHTITQTERIGPSWMAL